MAVRSVETIVRALNGAKVKHLIAGGLAVNARGYVRLTRAGDIVLGRERENPARPKLPPKNRHECRHSR